MKIDDCLCLESPHGAVTSTVCRTLFLLEFGNVAMRFTREDLYEFIEFLDQIELPDAADEYGEDERTVIIESDRFGVILMFTVDEFAELYELLVDVQIEDSRT